MTKQLLTTVTIILAGGLGQLEAGTILSFTGNLRTDASFTSCGSGCVLGAGNTDADYAQWSAVERDFSVGTFSAMTAITFSYGGGTNGNGAVIAESGFEPYLSLFDASGNFLASTFFGTTCPPGANTNSGSGQCFDELLDGGVLAPGNYSIVISAFENLSLAENSGVGTLADGFSGLGNLAGGEDLHYAFDVILQDASPVPEPASLGLVGCTILLTLGARRKRR